jgi:hypothetical protein
MGEPKAITYKEVRKLADSDASAVVLWHKIGDIAGAGHVPGYEEATIDLTELAPSKVERIDKLMAGEKDEPEASKSTKKEGK